MGFEIAPFSEGSPGFFIAGDFFAGRFVGDDEGASELMRSVFSDV